MSYEECIKACQESLEACNNCFQACLGEDHVQMMVDCIKLDRECADICSYAVQAMTRNSPFVQEICTLCAKICEDCARRVCKTRP